MCGVHTDTHRPGPDDVALKANASRLHGSAKYRISMETTNLFQVKGQLLPFYNKCDEADPGLFSGSHRGKNIRSPNIVRITWMTVFDVFFSINRTPEMRTRNTDISAGLAMLHQAPAEKRSDKNPTKTELAKIIRVARIGPEALVHDAPGIGRIRFKASELPVCSGFE